MGRRRADDPAVEFIVVRVTRAEREALEQVASENNTCRSRVIREAVVEYVSDYREGHPGLASFRITKKIA